MNRQPIPPDAIAMANNPEWVNDWARGLTEIAYSGILRLETAERLLAIVALIQRDVAITRLVELLNPTGARSRWDLATELALRLARFEATAWPRIRDGHRHTLGVIFHDAK